MKVTSVELQTTDVLNPYTSLVFSFRDPRRSNPYSVIDISGLGSEDIAPRFYEFTAVSAPGSQKYYNMAQSDREITITISSKATYSAGGKDFSALRDDIYKFISHARGGLVNLVFKNGSTSVAQISGFIKRVEPALFAKDPVVQIVFDCQYPTLKAPTRTQYPVASITDLSFITLTDSVSTKPHGFTATFGFTNSGRSSMLMWNPYDGGSGWKFEVIFGQTFVPGDTLYFSSEDNNKYLYAIKANNARYELIDKISLGSVWPIMFPGSTSLGFQSGGTNLTITSLSYYPTYWGL